MTTNIKVAVRVRPFRQNEKDCVVSFSETSLTATTEQGAKTLPSVTVVTEQGSKTFSVDYAYWSHSPNAKNFASQEMIFQELGGEMLQNIRDGINSCVFAYGHTGAGKSYTILGTPDAPGMAPRAISQIFLDQADALTEVRVWISFLDIYQETLRDLLHPDDSPPPNLRVVEIPSLGVCVPGLTEALCKSEEDAHWLLNFGAKKRAVGSTRMNAVSSRSSAILVVRTETTNCYKFREDVRAQQCRNAGINLVDLEGSERSTGKTNTDPCKGANINQGLSALTRVIFQLSAVNSRKKLGQENQASMRSVHQNNIPFRHSKLTLLLKEPLAGNCRTCMIAALSPAETSADETLATLRFASSISPIKTLAKPNSGSSDEMIKLLQDEIRRLRTPLASSEPQATEGLELSPEIMELDEMVGQWKMSYAKQLERTEQLVQRQRHTNLGSSVSLRQLNRSLGLDDDTPLLINHHDDAAVSGHLVYTLRCGMVTTLGNDASCSVQIPEIGLPKEVCRIINEDQERVSLHLSTDAQASLSSAVVLNGLQLRVGQAPKMLQHRDRITIGRTNSLSVVIPAQARKALENNKGIQSQASASASDAFVRNSFRMTDHRHLEELTWRLGGQLGTVVRERLRKVSLLVDEANEITSKVRCDEGLFFDIDLLCSVLRCSQDAPDVVVDDLIMIRLTEKGQMRYYWGMPKFLERLEAMRFAYQQHRLGRPPATGLQDPWLEPTSSQLHAVAALAPLSSVATNPPVAQSPTTVAPSPTTRLHPSTWPTASTDEELTPESPADKTLTPEVPPSNPIANVLRDMDPHASPPDLWIELLTLKDELNTQLQTQITQMTGLIAARDRAIDSLTAELSSFRAVSKSASLPIPPNIRQGTPGRGAGSTGQSSQGIRWCSPSEAQTTSCTPYSPRTPPTTPFTCDSQRAGTDKLIAAAAKLLPLQCHVAPQHIKAGVPPSSAPGTLAPTRLPTPMCSTAPNNNNNMRPPQAV